MAGTNVMPDGNDEIEAELPLLVELIARTARWVHPQTFHALPVWCPWTARGRPLYDRTWQRRATNTRRDSGVTSEKFEANVAAGKALVAALGVASPKPANWTVCHIWGYDDEAFAAQSAIVRNPRYYSCVGNMVWLPTPLKGFTDAIQREIQRRKARIRAMLDDQALTYFPRDDVREVLKFWKIEV